MKIIHNDIQRNRSSNYGFTIVELLIVVVVIAILAAITIVSYNGIKTRSVETALKADVRSGIGQIETTNAMNGVFPVSGSEANDGQGLKSSTDTEMTYLRKPYGYCLSSKSTDANISFAYKSSVGIIETGSCGATITSIAGSAYANAYVDATGSAARFYWPRDVAVNASGTLFVTDSVNHRIRQITPAGVVTTFAGSGTAGTADGAGVSAQFNTPTGIAIDSGGTLYVTDYTSNRIRKITPGGSVSTLAGSSQGFLDHATGTSAQFYSPSGITVDSAGNAYVADRNNNRIRKITPSGSVSTLAGSTQGYQEGTGAAARFSGPYAVEVDPSGSVFVADSGNSRVRLVTAAGVASTFAGSGNFGYTNGPGTSAEFGNILGITRDSFGNIYVSESNSYRVRVISPSGTVSAYGGNGTDGTNDGSDGTAQLTVPQGLTIDANGIIYIVDSGRIRKLE